MRPYYEDGSVAIYHGDCREILPTLPPPGLVLTDPPYGIGANKMQLGQGPRLYRGENDWDAQAPDLDQILALNVPTVVWGGNFFPLPVSRCWFVWDKVHAEGNDYADCELAWTNRDAVVRRFTHSWNGANARERRDGRRWHPTQKPVPLMAWCIDFFPDARIVLDPYMGSGTTLVAAKALGRKAIGIEIEERYCEMAVKRLAQETLGLSA